MADYIDREALVERLTRNLNSCNPGTFSERCYQDAINTVTFTPASDVAPVVHGEWTTIEDDYTGMTALECSECNEEWWFEDDPPIKYYHYCPNCGAKMDGDKHGS